MASVAGSGDNSPEYEAAVKLINSSDPMTAGKKALLDANVAFREIDDVTGLDLEHLQNELYKQSNLKKGWDRARAVEHAATQKIRKKNPLTDEEIIEKLEAGDLKHPTVQAYRESFDRLRALANSTSKDGLGLQIDKRANYVPMYKKSGMDLTIALERKIDELKDTSDKSFKELRDLYRKAKGDDAEALAELDKLPHLKDLGYLKTYVERATGVNINSLEDLKKVKPLLRDPLVIQRAADPQVSATFAREKGIPPMWLRDTNIDRLLWRNADQASQAAFITPFTKKLGTRASALRKLGMDEAADYVDNYRRGMNGIQIGKARAYAPGEMLKRRLRFWGEDLDSDALRASSDLVDAFASAIYPNLLGLNPKTLVRNLTQPALMTTAELGFKDATGATARAYAKLAKQLVTGGWGKARKDAVARGIIPEQSSAADFEGIASGVAQYAKSKGVRTTQAAINAYSNAVMKLYTMTDEINRMVTADMAEDIAKRYMASGGGAAADRMVAGMPKGIQRKIQRLNNNALHLSDEELEDKVGEVIRNYLLVQTQLAYGKVGSNELGRRLGPGLSMLSKWPVAVTSDVYKKASDKEFGKLLTKYVGPAVALAGMQGLIEDRNGRMSERQKAFIGGPGLSAWAPITSVFSAPEVTSFVNLSTPMDFASQMYSYGSKEIGGSANARDRRRAKRAAKRMLIQYTPVAGGMLNQYENIVERAVMNKRPD